MKRRIRIRIVAFLVVFCMSFSGLSINVMAEENAITAINVHSPEDLLCGTMINSETPFSFEYEGEGYKLDEGVIISEYNQDGTYTAFEGKINAAETYTAYFSVSTLDGNVFDDELMIEVNYNSEINCEIKEKSENNIKFIAELSARHQPDWASYEYESGNCMKAGKTTYTCEGCNEFIEEDEAINPDNHDWGEWTVVKEGTKTENGLEKHVCGICGTEETRETPKYVMPYSKVYEPNTSISMAATIAWKSDSTAIEVAGKDVRPATCFVWLDNNLNVYDRDNTLLSNNFDQFVENISPTMIPAFYISDQETATALKTRIQELTLSDCFVVSTPDKSNLVKDVADLLHVRGMLDYTSVENPDSKTLTDMVAAVNGAHGKVILMNKNAATRESIHKLQSLCSVVWVECSSETKELLTALTNGANGLVVDDYNKAIETEEWFKDDEPTLLRNPLVIGHRGDPSTYVENTVDSIVGAYEEGVDGVENDIQLSADGELFILHDSVLWSLYNYSEDISAESMTLEELRTHKMDWDDPERGVPYANEVSAENSRYGTLYGQDEKKEYVVSTLRDYIENLKGKDVVHVTEIKSNNLDILPTYKALVDEYDAWDQFFNITFNANILEEMYKNYPELSVSALCLLGQTENNEGMLGVGNPIETTERKGAEAGLQEVCSVLDQYNAAYSPFYMVYGPGLVSAGRHRGLLTMTWTYSIKNDFAKDYLFGLNGLTTDYAWWASELIEEISSKDENVKSLDEIAKPNAKNKQGNEFVLENAELVKVEDIDEEHALMIWRYKADMNLGGESFGNYYLYSNPFTVEIPKAEQNNTDSSSQEPTKQQETEQPSTHQTTTQQPSTKQQTNQNSKNTKTTKKIKAPSKASISSLKNVEDKKMVIKWKKVKDAKGYQVEWALNKQFTKSAKAKPIKGNSNKSLSLTVKNLKKSKIYYVRVRAFKTDAKGKRVYGKWSSVKKVKIKK